MNTSFMGIDIGTSSVRAVLFDEKGTAILSHSIEYSLQGSGGFAELKVQEIFDGLVKCIRVCVESKPYDSFIEGIGFSCQMHSLLCVDSKGNFLTNIITWADTRAIKQAESMMDVAKLYNLTGCRTQHPMYPLSKIMWLKENQPEIFKATSKFITIKEYILYQFFGTYLVDYTLAASQGLLDIRTNKWSSEMVAIAGISKDNLSDVVPCNYVIKGLKPEMARMLGLSEMTPFVIGSGDGIMANLGCGVSDDTVLSSTVGTSGAIRTSVKAPLLDSQQRTWCYSFTDDTWVAGGATNNGGIALKFLKEHFGEQILKDTELVTGEEYKAMDILASKISPGSDGLVFLPYLTGERSPDWNPNVRGLMGGLELNHGNGHICRAAMEGIIYRLFSVYKVMATINSNATQIRATGGYIKSKVWLQIQADVFGKEILVPKTQEGSALGAAFTAMVGVGAMSGFGEKLDAMNPIASVQPNMSAHNEYKIAYERAMSLYESVSLWHDNKK